MLLDQAFRLSSILLAAAGNETTRNAISHGAWELHNDRAQWDAWAADPGCYLDDAELGMAAAEAAC